MYYTLNGLGERVGKVTINVTGGPILKTGIGYDYDQSGRLLGEYAAAGHGGPTNEYIYLDNTPIGYVSNGTLYYIETDHLGTPRQVIQPGATTASDTLVWTWDYFGNAFGSDVPSLQTITFNLRYPGQYFDQETGLHYNYYRDYEPGSGRYIESDPIGVRAGPNTYAYTRNNPSRYIDRKGLLTGQLGFSGSLGGLGVAVNGSTGLAIDSKGNIGLYNTYGYGVGNGYGIDGGVSVLGSNAKTNDDLSGWFKDVSVAGGEGAGGAGEFFTGPSSHGDVTGGGMTFGGGLGEDVSITDTNTEITPLINGDDVIKLLWDLSPVKITWHNPCP